LIGPFWGYLGLKVEKPLHIFFYTTNGWMITKLCSILGQCFIKFAHKNSIGPFKGPQKFKIEKPLNVYF
jgi:hypothetical protein